MPVDATRILMFLIFMTCTLTYLACWILAYRRTKDIGNLGQQALALNMWWFTNGDLLPKEDDHLRYKAMFSLSALWCSIGAFFWFVE